MNQTTVDGRYLAYCETEKQSRAITEIIASDTVAEAAINLGVSERSLRRMIAKVRRCALAQGDQLLPVDRQTNVIRDEEGRIKRWDKTKIDNSAITIEDIRQGLECKPAKPKKPPMDVNPDICSVLGITDVHLGMMAYAPETGGTDWGTDTARDLVMLAIDQLMPPRHKVNHCIVWNGGDLAHADGMIPATSQSHNVLDMDARPGYVARTATQLMIFAIDRALKCSETVDVVNIKGNHDKKTMLMFNIALQMYYRNEPRVTILDNDCDAQLRVWGGNFIYSHHGDGVSNQDMYNAMTRDFPTEWGNTRYHWGLCGHLHSSRDKPIGAARIETLSTLAPCDSWHASKLYGAERKMHRIDLHYKGGELFRQTFNPVLHTLIQEAA